MIEWIKGGGTMETTVVEADEPLSKALNSILETGTAVIVTKNGYYKGIIDDRHLRQNIADASKVKCENVMVTAPYLTQKSSILEKLNQFLTGHFKALPVVNEKEKPIGLFTRTDLLAELLKAKIVPNIRVEAVMSSPVISINENETVGAAKRLMKENNINRVLVMRNGRPYALLSKFDFATFIILPKKKRGKSLIPEVVGIIDDRRLADLPLSDSIAMCEKDEWLSTAIEKMCERTVSALVVVSNNKPVGILTAVDIFKNIIQLFDKKREIEISGLDENDMKYYEIIKKKINSVIEKFSDTLNIGKVSLHFKKKKTLYIAKAFVELSHSSINVSYEDYDIKTTINGIAKEVETTLEKKKERLKDKKKKKEEVAIEGGII